MNAKLSSILFVILASLFVPAAASAADLDVYMYFYDTRIDRDNSYGSRLSTSTQYTNRSVKAGLWVSVWDMDGSCRDWKAGCGESDDDFLELSTTNSSGHIDFGAQPTTDPGGTGYPDLYLLVDYSHSGAKVDIFDEYGDRPIVVSPVHVEYSSYSPIYFNITCPDPEHNNIITYAGFCDDDTQVGYYFSDEEGYSNLLMSLWDVRDRFTTSSLERNGHTNYFQAYYGDSPSCDCSSVVARSCGYDTICLNYDSSTFNHAVAHEAGHSMMRRSLNVSGTLATCTGGWEFDDPAANEKCATSEGWADFTAGATYYERYASAPEVASNSLEGDWGSDHCIDLGGDPELVPGNVARFFWDLFDNTTVDDTVGSFSDDTTWYHGSALCDTWDRFDPGTDNREASEADSDGRNVIDFSYNEAESGSATSEYVINCLSSQDYY